LCGSALAQVTNSTKNPKQVAILHWYQANQTTSFAVGRAPTSITFDGANIWVVNSAASNVSKLRASDGEVLGTFAVPANPVGVAFDGANIWVTGSAGSPSDHGGSVSKLRASDGALLGTFDPAPAFPQNTLPVAIAFDGTNVWVVNSGGNSVS